jgi:hypothetical protein
MQVIDNLRTDPIHIDQAQRLSERNLHEEDTAGFPHWMPDTTSFIEVHRGVPERSVLLGLCSDSYPVLLDLKDSCTGPILVLGDSGCGKTRLMRLIVQTAMAYHSPHEVKFIVDPAAPGEWDDLIQAGMDSGHWLRTHSQSDSPADWIPHLAQVAEKRHNMQQSHFSILILLDDASYIRSESTDFLRHFEWLCKMGPPVQIWPIVSLQTQDALTMGRWIRHFKMRLLGLMDDHAAERLGLHYSPGFQESETNETPFATWNKEAWLKFWLPGEQETPQESQR